MLNKYAFVSDTKISKFLLFCKRVSYYYSFVMFSSEFLQAFLEPFFVEDQNTYKNLRLDKYS